MPLFDTHSRVTHRPEPVFALLALVQATLIFTITLVAVPLPLIRVEFDLSTADLVVLQIAYGLPYSGLLLLGGNLTDRFGGTSLMRTGLWDVDLTSLGAALAPRFGSLVAMLGLQEIAATLVAPCRLGTGRGTGSVGREAAGWSLAFMAAAGIAFLRVMFAICVMKWPRMTGAQK